MAETDDDILHVMPVDDLIEHHADEDCPCGPTVRIEQREGRSDGHLWVHHSLDGRELHEGTEA